MTCNGCFVACVVFVATMFVSSPTCAGNSLAGKIEDSPAKSPLQGGIQRSASPQLDGQVAGPESVPLRSGTTNASATMRIIQFRQFNGTPVVVPKPLTQAEIDSARYRDGTNSNRVPIRTTSESQLPSPRGAISDQRPSLHSGANDQRPNHTAPIGRPQRPDLASDSSPTRSTVGGSDGRPIRKLIEISGPAHFDPVPDRIPQGLPEPSPAESTTDANNVLAQPTSPDRAQVVPVAPRSDNRANQTVDKRFQQEGSQEESAKEKRRKNADAELVPKVQPQLTVPIDEALLWDAWYQRVNNLVCQALTKTMPKHGNPAGTNRIQITVWPNHRLEPRLVEGSNAKFDQAILEAYSSLNGSPALEFPAGTKRLVNVYETAHIQEIPAPTTSFESKTIHGDVETLIK